MQGLSDAPAIQEIYALYVSDTAISFEEAVTEMPTRMTQVMIMKQYLWRVFERDEQILA